MGGRRPDSAIESERDVRTAFSLVLDGHPACLRGHRHAPKFYALKKGPLTSPVSIVPRNTASAIVAVSDIYLPRTSNPGGSIVLDGAATGTWQLVAIVADSSTVNFNDPTSWSAWDVGTFMIGLPWAGTGTYAACP